MACVGQLTGAGGGWGKRERTGLENGTLQCVLQPSGETEDRPSGCPPARQILANKGQINLIYAAFMLAVLNVVDKWIRLSLADPWLHPLNQVGGGWGGARVHVSKVRSPTVRLRPTPAVGGPLAAPAERGG